MKTTAMFALLPLSFCLALAACSDPSLNATTDPSDTARTDTINYALDTDSALMLVDNTTPPQGMYQVVLPCTDCKGIDHTILFNPDMSYRLEESPLDSKKEGIKSIRGNWKPVNGTIYIYKDSTVQARYTWKGETLRYMEQQTGRPIPMRHLPYALENDTWSKKRMEGLEFYGVGNEPFWNIEIDEQKAISFRLADWPRTLRLKPVMPSVSPDSTLYTAVNDTARLQVVIYPTFCNDGMSDYQYSHSVKVAYNGQVYRGCGIMYK